MRGLFLVCGDDDTHLEKALELILQSPPLKNKTISSSSSNKADIIMPLPETILEALKAKNKKLVIYPTKECPTNLTSQANAIVTIRGRNFEVIKPEKHKASLPLNHIKEIKNIMTKLLLELDA
jgi:hypothetical protein